MKKFFNTILTLIVVISGIITFLLFFGIIQEYHYHDKFKKTTISLNNKGLIKNWGEADHKLINKTDKAKTVIYYKGILGINAYVFEFDKNNKLTAKYIDD